MTEHVFDCFIKPLSACFTVRPGQDFELFGKQLIEDLKTYAAPTLEQAVVTLRRTHRASTWPTIAECLEAVREAAFKQYRPPEPVEEPIAPLAAAKVVQALEKLKLDPGGAMLSMAEMHSCPVGTQFWVGDATIRYTNGAVETWGEFRRCRAAEKAA